MIKTGPEATMEELICSDDPMGVLNRPESGIAFGELDDLLSGDDRDRVPEILLVSTHADKMEVFYSHKKMTHIP